MPTYLTYYLLKQYTCSHVACNYCILVDLEIVKGEGVLQQES